MFAFGCFAAAAGRVAETGEQWDDKESGRQHEYDYGPQRNEAVEELVGVGARSVVACERNEPLLVVQVARHRVDHIAGDLKWILKHLVYSVCRVSSPLSNGGFNS